MMLSIRWRLTLWNTLALAVVLLGFSGVVYGLLHKTLYARLDDLLKGEWSELERDARIGEDPRRWMAYWIGEFQEHEKVICVAYDAKGQVFAKTDTLAESSVPAAPEVGDGRGRFEDQTLPALGRQRQLVGRFRAGDAEYVVLLMAPLEEVDLELSRLLAVLATAVPVTLALGGFLAYGLARKALAPVEQLNRLAAGITASRLDRRLPVANPGDELGRLACTINEMIARLERSFVEIRRFTADASHELRTPLTAIRVETEVALQKSITPAECQQLLGSILEECERLTRLTDQLLTLSREDARPAQPTRDPVNLAAVVGAVVENMRPLAEAKGLHVHLSLNGVVPICGEEIRLRQIFYNLVDNAIKYTPAGGTVAVSCEARDAAAIVAVRDTGIGIAPEHVPRVFDRFYRVDKDRSREEGGTGLGLSIAQSIVAAHGGRMELASTPGEGTICTVVLPKDQGHGHEIGAKTG
jgi:heavy metal sensor kinase